MNAGDAMRARLIPLGLVIFDCDGVIVNSEGVTSRVVAAELSAIGWQMDVAAAERLFRGMTIIDMEPLIAAQLRRPVDTSWSISLMQQIVTAMTNEVDLIDGALDALNGVEHLGLPWRIASNSSHDELSAKFARTGLTARVTGRVHSYQDVACGKPAPDLFLAAAAAQGVAAAACIVIEDSVRGAASARAAGMDCLGFSPHDDGSDMEAQGAYVIKQMSDVPKLLALATGRSL